MKVRMAPTAIPLNTQRKITIASDAWKCQARKEMDTGAAFCTEKMTTKTMIISAMIAFTMISSFLIFCPSSGELP
jgi:hypothetical protein